MVFKKVLAHNNADVYNWKSSYLWFFDKGTYNDILIADLSKVFECINLLITMLHEYDLL